MGFLDRFTDMMRRSVGMAPAEAPPAAESAATAVAEPPQAVDSAPAAEAWAPSFDAAAALDAAASTVTEVAIDPNAGAPQAAPALDELAAASAVAADAATAPAEQPVEVAMAAEPVAAEAPPAKSAEEILEDQLWAETADAWANSNFEKVTELLDKLRALDPEHQAEIDEKIAAAYFNFASQIEQSGDLNRALYLFQEAKRRNPALGEADFAIERVQTALAPAPEPVVEAAAMAAPPEQSYTVESGDTLSAIAEKFYGDANQYPRIFEANRDQLDNPDMIQVGQTLRIPM